MLGVKRLLLCVVLFRTNAHLISVKIVRDTNSPNLNGNEIVAKSQSSNFSGPSHLIYLSEHCYSYSTDKYEYSVCPFNNITQHEKVWHSGAFNGILGIWKEWSIVNNSFDSLIFSDGDDCEEGVQRNSKLIWICNRDINETIERVVDIKEPKKCFYEISFASDFGCENKYIYRHLSPERRKDWDQIETNYFYEELTPFGYESALRQLFVESGFLLNTTVDWFNVNDFDTKDKCLEQFLLLKEENKNLIKRNEFLEKQLKT